MDIRHLKMIQEVARQGNLTKAAEHLYLSQSALSHQLKDIEDYFKTQIFIRQKKQMLLTDAGKLILEASEKILAELEVIKNKIVCLTDKNAGEIRLSTECYTSYHWLLPSFQNLKHCIRKCRSILVRKQRIILSTHYWRIKLILGL
jgi:LysR family transcriptional regulator, regulator for metE and metH